MDPLLAFPIPALPGTPGWVDLLFGLAAITGFAALVWGVVSYLRNHRDD